MPILLLIYFLIGFSSFTSVSFIFIKKGLLGITATDWVSIGIWASLPWSIKVLYATVIDQIPLFKSNRKSYLILSALLMAVGNLLILDLIYFKTLSLSPYGLLAISGFILSSGVVMADIIADTLAIDIVKRIQNTKEYQYQLGRVGVNSRLSQMAGSLLAAGITGIVATVFLPYQVFLYWLAIPTILIIGALVLEVKEPVVRPGLDTRLFKAGFIFLLTSMGSLLLLGPDKSQIPVFIFSLGFIIYLGKDFILELSSDIRQLFIYSVLAVFMFRVMPSASEPVEWWMIGHLKLDELFFGNLRIISALTGFVSLFLFKNWVSRSSLVRLLIIFSIFQAVLDLPILMAYYNIGHPETLLIFDTAVASPLGNLAMIPLHILLSQYAPEKNRAIYVAVTAAFVNLSLTAGDLILKGLTSVFVVTQTDYSQLGKLIASCIIVSLLFSILGIYLLTKKGINR